jgi:hypothetical protein
MQTQTVDVPAAEFDESGEPSADPGPAALEAPSAATEPEGEPLGRSAAARQAVEPGTEANIIEEPESAAALVVEEPPGASPGPVEATAGTAVDESEHVFLP